MNSLDLIFITRNSALHSSQLFIECFKFNKINYQIFSPDELCQLDQSFIFKLEKSQTPVLLRISDYEFLKTITKLHEYKLNYINSISAYLKSKNKWMTLVEWEKNRIPFPKSFLLRAVNKSSQFDYESEVINTENKKIFLGSVKNFKELSAPFIVKELYSSKGVGVYLVQNTDELFELQKKLNFSDLILQEFVEINSGRDVRIFMIKNKIGYKIWAYSRVNEKSFKSNLFNGGVANKVELTDIELEKACRIFELSGLDYAGIDYLDRGQVFIEINPCPGLKGVQDVFNVNLANEIYSAFFSDINRI